MSRPLSLFLAALVATATGSVAEARVYQWRNPSTGSVELSGTPPAWYRGRDGGPRIIVYQNGQLFDDTAIGVEPAVGEQLRDNAFQEFERRQQEEALKRLERAARRERARQREASELAPEAAVAAGESEQVVSPVAAAVDEIPEILDPQVIDRLKDILQAWDRQQIGN